MYAPPQFRIQSYELPCECPRQRKRKDSYTNDLGYLKSNFFSNIGYHKPSLTIFVFDYSKHPANEKWDWTEIESKILAQVQSHSTKWSQKDLQVPSRYILIIMLPANVTGVNLKEHREQFINTLKQNGDDWVKNNFYFSMGGYNTLKTTQLKEFTTRVYNLSKDYYKQKKEIQKKKEKKLLPGQTHHLVRHTFKMGVYGIITDNSYDKAQQRF